MENTNNDKLQPSSTPPVEEPQIQKQAPIETPASPAPPDIPQPVEKKPESEESKNKLRPIFIVVIILLFIGAVGYLVMYGRSFITPFLNPKSEEVPIASSQKFEFKKFSSDAEFAEFTKNVEASGLLSPVGDLGITANQAPTTGGTIDLAPESSGFGAMEGLRAEPPRVSETNVQVAGIDEPDIVKTDGQELYYSQNLNFFRTLPQPLLEEDEIGISIPPEFEEPKTKAIKVFPPYEMSLDSEIDASGNLLLVDDMLLVFETKKVSGYDVSDPSSPSKTWTFDLDDKQEIVTSRLYGNKVYLVSRTFLNSFSPCPMPLVVNGLTVPCTDIYYPVGLNVPADSTYTALVINPSDGEVEDKISFVGSNSNAIIYMSPNSLYATYTYYTDLVEFLYNFFNEKGQDLMPVEFISSLEELSKMNLSQEAKLAEMMVLMEKYLQSIDSDQELRISTELENRMTEYLAENARSLEQTGIVKIDIDGFDISATTTVPGTPLNQFSLDEYQDNLRVATTITGGIWGSQGSANDVYVMNKNLEMLGSVKDLGLTERIYSTRFIEDKGYVVTFRQIDPFYVIDLTDPSNPKMAGELKIPGFSSYLHPIDKDKIIGVGEEEGKVKISLFDVSNPEEPKEISKYSLDEYYTEVEDNHHAFLMDDRHKVFFLPGSKGGYIISYDNDQLNLKMAVADVSAQRAIYIDDYMYIIGMDKISVFDENKWEKVKEFEL